MLKKKINIRKMQNGLAGLPWSTNGQPGRMAQLIRALLRSPLGWNWEEEFRARRSSRLASRGLARPGMFHS